MGYALRRGPSTSNYGQLVKRLRNLRASLAEQRWAERIVNHFGATESGLRWALRLGHAAEKVIGVGGLRSLTGWLKRFGGANLSEWMSDTPFAAAGVQRARKGDERAGYLPACISRIMGRLPANRG